MGYYIIPIAGHGTVFYDIIHATQGMGAGRV